MGFIIFNTRLYEWKSLAKRHGVIPNMNLLQAVEHVQSLCGVDHITMLTNGDVEEDESILIVKYSRKLLYWYLRMMGFNGNEIAEMAGVPHYQVSRGITWINEQSKCLDYVYRDTQELSELLTTYRQTG